MTDGEEEMETGSIVDPVTPPSPLPTLNSYSLCNRLIHYGYNIAIEYLL
jgi:hypothetical protein